MGNYKTRAIPVTAMQFDGSNKQALADFANAHIIRPDNDENTVVLYTLDGVYSFNIGDWITHSKGGYGRYTNRSFHELFEEE